MTFLLILLGIIAALAFYGVTIFNRLVALKNQFKNAFSQIEVQLKRRHELIPNLVETAKGYLKHETETLQAVTNARNAAANSLAKAASDPANASVMNELAGMEAALGSALGKLSVVVEAYPELKANANMMQLSEELTATENKVSFARQSYNDAVMNYNVYRQQFPNSIIANNFNHTSDAVLLEFEDREEIQKVPEVKF